MSFGDRLVLALYFGHAQYVPWGREAALRLLDVAVARGRLSPAGLSDTSLVLLLALLPSNSPHRPAVEGLVTSRGLHQNPAELARLSQAAPARLAELVAIQGASGRPLRDAALGALLAPNGLLLVENLRLYLARRFLINPNDPELDSLVTTLINQATERFARIPPGTVDYLGWLYRVVQWETRPGVDLPGLSPPALGPDWYQALPADEQHFINAYLDLDDRPADLLHLHFSALLNVQQIVEALHEGPQPPTAEAVVRRLEECWNVVL
jgi:hypothetical protein